VCFSELRTTPDSSIQEAKASRPAGGDKKWANGVISEVASAPKGKFNDLCDTASAALSHMRDHGLLSLGEEFRREERRKLVYRSSRDRGPSVRELYEGA
jgi:hypothetical protein